jgi:hypothetical protein
MKRWFYEMLAKLTGRNFSFTPKDVVVSQMTEPRPLPLGRQEFEEWSDRLIAGAMIQGGKEDPKVFIEGQKFALANMLLHLGPTESHKPDAHFIHSLRKVAVNQVAHMISLEIKEASNARVAAKKAREEAEAESDEPIKLCKPEDTHQTMN